MRIEYSEQFRKLLKEAPRDIKERFFEVVADFSEDPYAEWLRNHALHGQLSGMRSIDITDDYRAVFKVEEKTNTVIFRLFGTHDELYG